MTKRLTRDADAFAARVRMSRIRAFILVEGRKSDRPFYERVCGLLSGLRDSEFEIYVSEEVSITGAPEAGKRHSVALFEHWGKEGALEQTNSAGVHSIAIALDRDLDALSGRLIDSKHVLYSFGADVEADVLRFGDIVQGVADAFSLTRGQAQRIVPALGVFESLAFLWREWIIIGARGSAIGSETRYRGLSPINGKTKFGPLEAQPHQAITQQMFAEAVDKQATELASHAESQAQTTLDGVNAWTLLKGRWVAAYVQHLVDTARAGGDLIEAGVGQDTVTKACLAGSCIHGDLAAHHSGQLRRLLAS